MLKKNGCHSLEKHKGRQGETPKEMLIILPVLTFLPGQDGKSIRTLRGCLLVNPAMGNFDKGLLRKHGITMGDHRKGLSCYLRIALNK